MKKYSLFLVDDHALFIQCFESYIVQNNTFSWAGSSINIQEGFEKISIIKPDVVLIDFQLQNESGLDLLALIKDLPFKTCPVFLTMSRDEKLKEVAFSNGARGYLLKYMEASDIISALWEIVQNDCVYSPPDHFFNHDTSMMRLPLGLTNREFEIASLVCNGYTSYQIGKKLFLSTLTVNTHRRNILAKIGVQNAAALCKILQPFI